MFSYHKLVIYTTYLWYYFHYTVPALFMKHRKLRYTVFIKMSQLQEHDRYLKHKAFN